MHSQVIAGFRRRFGHQIHQLSQESLMDLQIFYVISLKAVVESFRIL